MMKVKDFGRNGNIEVYAYNGYSEVFEDNLEFVCGTGSVTDVSLQDIAEVEAVEYYILGYDEYMDIFPSCKEHVPESEYEETCVVLVSEDWRQEIAELPYTLTSRKDVEKILKRGGSAKLQLEDELCEWLDSLTLSSIAREVVDSTDTLIDVFGLCTCVQDVEDMAAEIYSDED